MSSLRNEMQILYFRNNYSKLALKNYAKGFLQPCFPKSVRTSCPKRPLLTFVSMCLMCPISNGMFPSQSAPKVLLDSNNYGIVQTA